VARFYAVYEADIVAPDLRTAKKQLREIFEFGVSPKEVTEEIVAGLKRVPDSCPHRISACNACGAAITSTKERPR
jgi:hypothetical protein